MKLMRSLVISIFLYDCESGTLTAELEKRTQVSDDIIQKDFLTFPMSTMLQMRRFAKRYKPPFEKPPYDKLLTLVKKRKLM